MKQKCSTKEALLKGRLSTFDLLILINVHQLLFILKIFVILVEKPASLICIVLSLPLQ
jgi:hypothetical protein